MFHNIVIILALHNAAYNIYIASAIALNFRLQPYNLQLDAEKILMSSKTLLCGLWWVVNGNVANV